MQSHTVFSPYFGSDMPGTRNNAGRQSHFFSFFVLHSLVLTAWLCCVEIGKRHLTTLVFSFGKVLCSHLKLQYCNWYLGGFEMMPFCLGLARIAVTPYCVGSAIHAIDPMRYFHHIGKGSAFIRRFIRLSLNGLCWNGLTE